MAAILHGITCKHLLQRMMVDKQNFERKTNEKVLKTLSFNDNDKIKGKVNSTRFDFLV